ncbi:hypothetical protein DOY81_011412 [Sarcophaga bullata]|nr:hypothetical protein DOY81_011412 [Sarcophaga bullata]
MNKHEGIPPPEISCDVCGLKLASERNLKRIKDLNILLGGKQETSLSLMPKVSPH